MRLIDADMLIPKLSFILKAENQIYGRGSWGFSAKCIHAVEDAPTVELEQQADRWKELHSDRGPLWECPDCGYRVNPEDGGIYHYCSACGKKLEEDDG